MIGFESIVGQDLPISILKAFLIRGSVPHAILFSGIDGIGKKSAAKTFAMSCNCQAQGDGKRPEELKPVVDPCGQCAACKKILADNHPDVLRVKPVGNSIRISQIRELCHILSMRPYEARRRVVIMDQAQTMTPEAANAFLKMLEEPPAQTTLILVTKQASDLLSTVLSRCHHIRFHPLKKERLVEILVQKSGLDSTRAQVVGAMANGSYTAALEMADPSSSRKWMQRRSWIVSELARLTERPVQLMLMFAENLAKSKDRLPEALDIMATWFRDIAVCKQDRNFIINKDLAEKIEHVSQKVTMQQALSCLEAVQRTEKQLKQNANPRLAMEALTIRLAGLIKYEESGHQIQACR